MSIDDASWKDWDKTRREKILDELTGQAQELEDYEIDKLIRDQRASDKQISGSHYKKYPIQPYHYCFVNKLNNLQSEAISYITRYKDKGGKQDLEKAIHTIELLIEAEGYGY